MGNLIWSKIAGNLWSGSKLHFKRVTFAAIELRMMRIGCDGSVTTEWIAFIALDVVTSVDTKLQKYLKQAISYEQHH